MIFRSLKLTNFMSYRQMNEPINFAGIKIACLSGPNGAGKSTLLDAITWALWGKTFRILGKGMTIDDLIHSKETHMQVELSFEFEGNLYRVIRFRNKAKQISRLEFQIFSQGKWSSLTGGNIRETQEKINQILKMDHETFTTSSFILQGKADSFLALTPEKRKEVLSDILGLSIYDELKERAKEKSRLAEKELAQIQAQRELLKEEFAQEETYLNEKTNLKKRLKEIEEKLRKKEKEFNLISEEKAKYETKKSQLGELNKRIEEIQNEILEEKENQKKLKERVEKAKKLINERERIIKGYQRLKKLEEKEASLSEKSKTFLHLKNELSQVEQKIVEKESEAKKELETLKKRAEELKNESTIIPHLLQKEKELSKVLERSNLLKIEREQLINKWTKYKNKVAILNEKNNNLNEKIDLNWEKIELIDKEKKSKCPLCQKRLNKEEKNALKKRLEEEISNIKNEIKQNINESERIKRELKKIEAEGKKIKEWLEKKEKYQHEIGKIKEKIKSAKEARELLQQIEENTKTLEKNLKEKRLVQEEFAALQRVKKNLEQLSYSPNEHEEVRIKINQLKTFEIEKFELDSAEKNAVTWQEEIKRIDQKIKRKDENQREIEKKRNQLLEEISQGDKVETKFSQTFEDLKFLRKERENISNQIAIYLDALKRIKEKAAKENELKARCESLSHEISIYEELSNAFGKKGIPAQIIENVLPELEKEANQILNCLTEGRVKIHFNPLREKRSGGTIETLDLKVSDGELGIRNYELFSGGEAFRINFAIRVALSKLLAKRAGARLETLVIDEGFGSLDDEGKEKIIESISAIKEEFKKIFVITHLEELKDKFETRLEVTKKEGEGSIVKII